MTRVKVIPFSLVFHEVNLGSSFGYPIFRAISACQFNVIGRLCGAEPNFLSGLLPMMNVRVPPLTMS